MNRTLRLYNFENDFFSHFPEFFSHNHLAQSRSNVDYVEAEKHYLISVDLPGVTKEDIKISLEDGYLQVQGQRKRGNTDFAKYQKSFRLPKEVNTKAIEAQFTDGVLEIAIPKAEKHIETIEIAVKDKQNSLWQKFLPEKKDTAKKCS